MRMAVTLLRKAGYSVAIAAAVAFSATAPADTLGLPDTPLFLASGAQPNLIMAIDDSGSMDFETLFPTNDGAAWWRLGDVGQCRSQYNDSFVGCISNSTGTEDIPTANRLNFANDGGGDSWRKFTYLFPNGASGSNTTARRRSSDGSGHYAIPPIPAYAWARSPNHNKSYFDPKTRYTPWVSSDGFTFGAASYTAASFDPVFEPEVTVNLTLDRAGTGSVAEDIGCSSSNTNIADDHVFRVYRGMTLPSGTCIRRSGTTSWESLTADCEVDADACSVDNGDLVGIRYFPATFYLASTTSLPDDYGYTGTVTTTGKAPDGTALNGYEIKPGNFASTEQYDRAIQNFANWFTYYRKRHQALRAGLGESFSDISGIRVDGFTINNRQDVTMGSIDNATTKAALYRKFYSDWVRSGGTPNRSAVANMITNFKRTGEDAPITASCQKNFGMLFTDGFSNAPAAGDGIRGVYGNVDQNLGQPYSDTYSGSLADAVMSAYIDPLRTDLEQGKVSAAAGCPASGAYSGPLDCNRNPHMNFYAVTLNTRGLLFNPDADPAVDPYNANPALAWPLSFPARHPSAVDDLWHATINGRGKLLNARNPRDIATQVKSVLSSIIESTSSAGAGAINGASLNTGSLIYQARFNSSDWSGQLLSFQVNRLNGEPIPNSSQDAASRIPAAADRDIFTRNSAGQGVEFTWAALQGDADRVEQLDPNSDPVQAELMLNYLRGDPANEGIGRGQFRPRATSKLGDIVNSAPLYVGAPPFRYRDSLESASYSAFATANRDRSPMIYVGANDGMLHAFYADGSNRGQEAFAYIPGAVFPKLRTLASQSYGHQFYVDGSPGMGDAFFARGTEASPRWRTVLVGGLNKGGQGVYAIDVTNPGAVGANSVLWEFTDADDPDLGFTYSQPTIVKLRDGKWYAVFGNGYNSRLADGSPSTTGSAVLFIVDLATGNARKIDTGEGYAQRGDSAQFPEDSNIPYDNGLATPALVDTNGDRVVEFAYAGDLYGNLWKFDLSSTNPASWGVAFSGQPLFKARNGANQLQPITARPEVTRGPGGNGLMVLFGTGKYLEQSDKDLRPPFIQSFYGIVDLNTPVTYTDRSSVLTRQEIRQEVFVTRQAPDSGGPVENEIRITTDYPLGANQGWYMDLLSPRNGYEGEKQVTSPVVVDKRVIFTTLTPDPDACGFGGTSWLMELDYRDGSRLETSPFDLNRDGLFNDDDALMTTVDDVTGYIPPGGIRRKEILPRPVIAQGTYGSQGYPVQYKYMPGSSGNIVVIVENPGDASTGRQSWRQIR